MSDSKERYCNRCRVVSQRPRELRFIEFQDHAGKTIARFRLCAECYRRYAEFMRAA